MSFDNPFHPATSLMLLSSNEIKTSSLNKAVYMRTSNLPLSVEGITVMPSSGTSPPCTGLEMTDSASC